jgi:hypothetical protein
MRHIKIIALITVIVLLVIPAISMKNTGQLSGSGEPQSSGGSGSGGPQSSAGAPHSSADSGSGGSQSSTSSGSGGSQSSTGSGSGGPASSGYQSRSEVQPRSEINSGNGAQIRQESQIRTEDQPGADGTAPLQVRFGQEIKNQLMNTQIINAGEGFAFKNGEAHQLRLFVAESMIVPPAYVRNLLSENEKIDEIINAIQAKDKQEYLRGDLILDQTAYKLTNIKMTGDEAASTVEADLVDSKSCLAPWCSQVQSDIPLFGNLKVITTSKDGERLTEGTLVVTKGEQSGEYGVELNDFTPRIRHPGNGAL